MRASFTLLFPSSERGWQNNIETVGLTMYVQMCIYNQVRIFSGYFYDDFNNNTMGNLNN